MKWEENSDINWADLHLRGSSKNKVLYVSNVYENTSDRSGKTIFVVFWQKWMSRWILWMEKCIMRSYRPFFYGVFCNFHDGVCKSIYSYFICLWVDCEYTWNVIDYWEQFYVGTVRLWRECFEWDISQIWKHEVEITHWQVRMMLDLVAAIPFKSLFMAHSIPPGLCRNQFQGDYMNIQAGPFKSPTTDFHLKLWDLNRIRLLNNQKVNIMLLCNTIAIIDGPLNDEHMICKTICLSK